MEAVGRHIKHYIHLHSYTINYGPTMYYANTLSHLQQQIHEQHTSLVTGGGGNRVGWGWGIYTHNPKSLQNSPTLHLYTHNSSSLVQIPLHSMHACTRMKWDLNKPGPTVLGN